MGRDRKEKISTATYLDVHNVLHDLEMKYDTICEVQILTDPVGHALFVNASCAVWATPTYRKDFVIAVVCGQNTPPLASVVYQAATRLYHAVDAWVMRAPRRERTDH